MAVCLDTYLFCHSVVGGKWFGFLVSLEIMTVYVQAGHHLMYLTTHHSLYHRDLDMCHVTGSKQNQDGRPFN